VSLLRYSTAICKETRSGSNGSHINYWPYIRSQNHSSDNHTINFQTTGYCFEKPIPAQLVIKSPAIYGTHKFFAALPTACQWSTFCPHPHTLSLQSIIVKPSLYACLPRDFFSASCLINSLSPTHANYVLCQWSCDSSVSTVTSCEAGIPRVRIRAEVRDSSLLREASIPALAPIQPLVQLAFITQGLKWQGHEADALTSN